MLEIEVQKSIEIAVVGIKETKSGWVVETDKGTIECEHVVSCSGNFARQTGKMVGLDIPVIPVEHQFIVTEPHPEIVKRKKEGLPEMEFSEIATVVGI